MESNCVLNKEEVADSGQGVVHLGRCARGYQLSIVKEQLPTKCYTGPRNWGALVNAVMEGREFLD
jgi:hypothetical protein